MTMVAVTTKDEMRAHLAEYRQCAHETTKHLNSTLEVLYSLWRTSRREKRDVWGDLSTFKHPSSNDKVNGSAIKNAFRKYLDARQRGRCCYCRQWLVNSGHAKPIEHILPKVEYPQFSLHFWNLAVACTDCNLTKLKDVWGSISKDVFLYPGNTAYPDMFHPRFHSYDEHIRYVFVETNSGGIAIYEGLTPQGKHLCQSLLNKVATKRALVENNPELQASMSNISSYQAKLENIESPRLAEFAEMLNDSIVSILED